MDRTTPLELPLRIWHHRPFARLDVRHEHRRVSGVWAWLDTGGGAVLVGRGLASWLGLSATGPAFDGDGGRFTPIEAPVLSAGGRDLPLGAEQVLATEHDEIGPAAMRAPLFLPGRFFRQFTATFDAPVGVLRLSPPGTPPEGASLPATVHPHSGFVRVELDVLGERLGFLLDTGASYSMISEAVWRRWRADHPEWPTARGAFGVAQMTGAAFEAACRLVRVPHATLGPVTLTNVGFVTRPAGVFEEYLSALTDGPVVGALAGNVLRQLRVAVDYAGTRVGVSPDRADGSGDLDGPGVSLREEAGRFLVQGVRGSPGDVRTGDELLAVDGVEAHGRDLGEVLAALAGPPGTGVAVELRREGERRTARLRRSAVLP